MFLSTRIGYCFMDIPKEIVSLHHNHFLLTKNFRIMASRRSLKKTVNYITELAAGLCLVESANANAEKREAYSEEIGRGFP